MSFCVDNAGSTRAHPWIVSWCVCVSEGERGGGGGVDYAYLQLRAKLNCDGRRSPD